MVQLISKELFVSVLDGLRDQYFKDVSNSEKIGEVFGKEVGAYDNGILFASVIRLLQEWFPKEDGYCAIENFCFEREFGKKWNEEGEVWRETSEELYDVLTGRTPQF